MESPSTSSGNALARFEFEPGKSKDGTKILMVEWEEDETTRQLPGEWQVSWEGKTTVLPANDLPLGSGSGSGNKSRSNDDVNTGVKRLYFLLPPGVTVPSTVTLTKHALASASASASATAAAAASDASSSSSSSSSSSASASSTSSSTAPAQPQPIVWKTNPLPAIFPPELGASARASGKRGVLHTIWAKKRLQSLQREIEAESRANAEGVGLQMAVQEKEWIELNFGVVARPAQLRVSSGRAGGSPGGPASPMSPSSPRSPGGGRLMEKLKGLKLATSEKDLSSRDSSGSVGAAETMSSQAFNPLSPETSDVAVSSFSSIRGVSPSTQPSAPSPGTPLASLLEQKPFQQQQQKPHQPPAPSRKVAAQAPPASLLAQQQRAGMASLDAFAGSSFDTSLAGAGSVVNPAKSAKSATDAAASSADDREDDLFALPISPRSPEMTKSPFSFTAGETGKLRAVNVGERTS